MNITGNPSTGNYNLVEFFNSSPTNISTFNSSLCSVQRASNSQETLVVVKPDDLFPAFTQFVPNSGYIIRAKDNFTIPEDLSQPIYSSRAFNGSPTNGLYTIFENNFTSAVNINTFNSSLCSVQKASNSQETLVVVKPNDLFPAFTQFVPNSGYIVRAKNTFTINNPAGDINQIFDPYWDFTSLLITGLSSDYSFKDSSNYNRTISVGTDTNQCNYSPYNLNGESYNSTTHGGSIFIGANTSGLTLSYTGLGNQNWQHWWNQTNFSMECWVRLTSFGTNEGTLGSFRLMDWSNQSLGLQSLYFGVMSDGKLLLYTNDGTINKKVTSTSSITLNEWTHIAFVATNGAVSVYVNGVKNDLGNNWPVPLSTSSQARLFYGAQGARGNVSGYRTLRNTALYTSNFNPSTITSAPQNNSNTDILLNFTNFGVIDNTKRNIIVTTASNNTLTLSGQYAQNSSKGTIITQAQNLNFANKPFTIEAWIKPTNQTSVTGSIFKQTIPTPLASSPYDYFNLKLASNVPVFSFGTVNLATITGSNTITQGDWTHIALVRQGTTSNQTKLYVNGIVSAQGQCDFVFDASSQSNILVGDGISNAYISGLRITNGVARYLENFNVPESAFITKSSNNSKKYFVLNPSNYVKEGDTVIFKVCGGLDSNTDLTPYNFTGDINTYDIIPNSITSPQKISNINPNQAQTISVVTLAGSIENNILKNLNLEVENNNNSASVTILDDITEEIDPHRQYTTLHVQPNKFNALDKNNWTLYTTESQHSIFNPYSFNPNSYNPSRHGTGSALYKNTYENVPVATIPKWWESEFYTLECWVYVNSLGSDYTLNSNQFLTTQNAFAFYDLRDTYDTQYQFPNNIITLAYSPASFGIKNNQTINLWSPYSTIKTTTSIVPLSAWTHIALVKNRKDVSIFVNGVKNYMGNDFEGTTPYERNGIDPNMYLFGVTGGSSVHISNYKGTRNALYNYNFNPLKQTNSNSSDPHFNFVMNWDKAGIVDTTKKHSLKTINSVRYTSNNIQRPGSSGYLYFNGNNSISVDLFKSNELISDVNNTNYEAVEFGVDDFTVEGYLRTTNITLSSYPSSFYTLWGCFDVPKSSNTVPWGMAFHPLSGIAFWTTDGGYTTGGNLSANTWMHVAATRESNLLRLFLNGQQVASKNLNRSLGSGLNSKFNIGADVSYNTSAGFAQSTQTFNSTLSNCYLDDIRITNGYARYTSNFTPSTSAFSTETGRITSCKLIPPKLPLETNSNYEYVLLTPNLSAGTKIPYVISGGTQLYDLNSDDIGGVPLSGDLVVLNNRAALSGTVTASASLKPNLNATMTVAGLNKTSVLNDPYKYTYTLTSNKTGPLDYNGETATITLSGNRVPDGTKIPFYVNGIPSSRLGSTSVPYEINGDAGKGFFTMQNGVGTWTFQWQGCQGNFGNTINVMCLGNKVQMTTRGCLQ